MKATCNPRALVQARALLAASVALLFSLPVGAQTAAAAAPAHRAAAPKPMHIELGTIPTFSFPPTTSYCLAHFGIHCYQPFQFEKAYNLAPLHAAGIDGRGKTIIIVDAFGSPTIEHDLHVFDQTFNLPDPPSLTIIQAAGQVPPFDPTNGDMAGWAVETTLDVEWSHAIAPGAAIVLLETPVSETEGVQGFPEIVMAENYAIDHDLGDVISQSFAATEETFPDAASLLALRSAFKNAREHHVTVLAASGDWGASGYELNLMDFYPMRVNAWPSSDPLVTSVGGSKLTLDDAGNRLAPDVVWNDSGGAAGGGGVSAVFERPEFQEGVQSVVAGSRGTPDISMSAACDGVVVFYYSFLPTRIGYHLVCGTSEASPLFSGIVAMADQLAGRRLGHLNQALYSLYQQRRNTFIDITQGNNTFGPFTNSDGNTYTVQGYNAGPGYDLASGLGTLDANVLVHALAAQSDE